MKNRLAKLVHASLIGFLLSTSTTPGFTSDDFDITLNDGLVSIDATNTDVSLLLRNLSARVGFRLWIPDNLQSEPISVRVENQSIDKILRQMLADGSYALVYSDTGQVTALYVLPRGNEQSLTATSPPQGETALQKTLRSALESDSLPDNVKKALWDQANTDNEEIRRSLTENPTEAMDRVIRILEEIGSASPETMRQLRDKLQQQKSRQTE